MGQQTNLSFIFLFFEDFYYEILRQKERVLSNRWRQTLPSVLALEAPLSHEASSIKAMVGDGYQDPDVERILSSFQHILETQSLKANQEGGAFGVACYREAQYIMVALADEIFLGLPWEGRRYWESHLLEERTFSSHIAGERFFTFLDAFLKERNPLKQEIALLYLSALGLGFRGKYKGFDDGGALSLYREQLFTFIYRQSPSLFQTSQHLFPQATQHKLEGAPEQWNEDLRKWGLILLGVILGYFFLSYTVWYGTTYHLDMLTDSILEGLQQLR
ncbi:MAG: DotU family type IV/VI secretion system protein [Alphaproteobacteria bacterium]